MKEGFTKKYIEVYMCNIENGRIFIMDESHNAFISINFVHKGEKDLKRKIGTAVVSLSVLGFGIFGVSVGDGGGVVQADSIGDYGGAPIYTHADHWSPSYLHGNTGGAPAYEHGETPAPKLEADGDHHAPSYADGNTGGSPAFNKGDTPSQRL